MPFPTTYAPVYSARPAPAPLARLAPTSAPVPFTMPPPQSVPALPPRTVRGQMPETSPPPAPPRPAPAPVPVRIPTPQELGLLTPVPVADRALDWNGAHRRLQQLGATGIHLAPEADGAWRVSFALATNKPNQAHRIQAQAGSPEAALQAALARADAWLAETRK